MSSVSTPQHFGRSATIRAMLLVLIGSLGMQFSAVIAVGLFPAFGVLGTSALRMLLAAVILLIIFRPRLRGRTRREWSGIVLYGVAMAAMNAFLYLAFARLPLGIATTIDFLGPCLVALAASRRAREGLLAVVALLGVALIAGFGGALDPLGLIFAGLAGAAFGLYTLLAARVGQSDGGLPSVALSVTVAAILTLPFSAPWCLSCAWSTSFHCLRPRCSAPRSRSRSTRSRADSPRRVCWASSLRSILLWARFSARCSWTRCSPPSRSSASSWWSPREPELCGSPAGTGPLLRRMTSRRPRKLSA